MKFNSTTFNAAHTLPEKKICVLDEEYQQKIEEELHKRRHGKGSVKTPVPKEYQPKIEELVEIWKADKLKLEPLPFDLMTGPIAGRD